MAKEIQKFFHSEWYIILIFLLSMLNWNIGFNTLFVCVIIFGIYTLIMTCSKDSEPIIPLLLGCILANIANTEIMENNADEVISGLPLIYICILAAVMLIETILFIVRNHNDCKMKLIIGYLAIAIALFLSGTNNSDTKLIFDFSSLDAFLFLIIVLFYVLFSTTSKNNKVYLSKSLLYFGATIALQVFYFYFTNGFSTYLTITMKWGVSNAGAIILLMVLPVSAYTVMHRRPDLFHIALIFLEFAGCIATLSRGGIAVMLIVFPITCIYIVYRSEHRIEMVIYMTIMIGISFFVISQNINILKTYCIKAWEEMFNADGSLNSSFRWGSDDSQYKIAIKTFKNNLLFGEGTSYSATGNSVAFYHELFLDIAAKLGLVGCAAYLIHFIQKYKLLLKRMTSFKVLVLIGMLGGGAYGLIDVSYFNYIYLFVLVIIMTYVEKEDCDFKKYYISY